MTTQRKPQPSTTDPAVDSPQSQSGEQNAGLTFLGNADSPDRMRDALARDGAADVTAAGEVAVGGEPRQLTDPVQEAPEAPMGQQTAVTALGTAETPDEAQPITEGTNAPTSQVDGEQAGRAGTNPTPATVPVQPHTAPGEPIGGDPQAKFALPTGDDETGTYRLVTGMVRAAVTQTRATVTMEDGRQVIMPTGCVLLELPGGGLAFTSYEAFIAAFEGVSRG